MGIVLGISVAVTMILQLKWGANAQNPNNDNS